MARGGYIVDIGICFAKSGVMAKKSTSKLVSEQIWDEKYRLKGRDGRAIDGTLDETFRRVAQAAAAVEKKSARKKWETRFAEVMTDLTFLPAGRILAGAGSGRDVTLFNCFVMGRIEDDMSSIFDHVKEAALTMQKGGGIGHDFSSLRPRGALVEGVGVDASGPVSFMDIWDAMCRAIMSAGSRRGAMMGTLRCDHPDIEAFIEAKSDPDRLRMFNLSVLVTDAFIEALEADKDWDLVFNGRVYKSVRARVLWDKIMRATYEYAEPGVIFIDRINRENNLDYCEEIFATNPCGEQPLPAYGACLLGSVNLARLVRDPFGEGAGLDKKRLKKIVRIAVRFLDNIIDVSKYPLEAQRREALAKRRIGLGVTGLGDALAMCGIKYGTKAAAKRAKNWMATIERAAYETSSDLGKEKGVFPLYDEKSFQASAGVRRLNKKLRQKIKASGIRNGLLTSIAPTGTISLLAGNVSSGVEPMFDLKFDRDIREADGGTRRVEVEDYAYGLYREMFGDQAPLPDYFVTAHKLTPKQHLRMQSALQCHVDSSISKTINCPEDISFDGFRDIYLDAYRLGLKGCTTYRPNRVTGTVLYASHTGGGVDGKTDGEAEPGVRDDDFDQPGEVQEQKPRLKQFMHGPDSEEPDVVYMSAPLERDRQLLGATYKLRWPQSDHAYYVTINDIEVAGRRRPFEIFINSKNLEHYAWTVALTRMISAVFRRGGDVSFVAAELKDVFDPRGGLWMNGHYVPSLLAAIGDIVEQHLVGIGFMHVTEGGGTGSVGSVDSVGNDDSIALAQKYCPKCHSPSLINQEGCWVCRNCNYSKCN